MKRPRKTELESHLSKTYRDDGREDDLPPMEGLQRPTRPGVEFELGDVTRNEVDEFIRKARAKGSPGNDCVSYKIYKYCPKLRLRLHFYFYTT